MNNPPSTVEATVVTRSLNFNVKKFWKILFSLLEAGAIILGITTMPNNGVSWAVDDSACGVVNNPHDTRRMSGGNNLKFIEKFKMVTFIMLNLNLKNHNAKIS